MDVPLLSLSGKELTFVFYPYAYILFLLISLFPFLSFLLSIPWALIRIYINF